MSGGHNVCLSSQEGDIHDEQQVLYDDHLYSAPEVETIAINEYSWYTAFGALCTAFQDEGYELRIVGGAVRDMILKIQPKDIDLCTTATPEEMLKILERQNISFRKSARHLPHGTVTVCKNNVMFEVNSLRTDDMLNGEKVSRYGVSFEEDARRRDFTMNAMSLNVEGRLYDYFQGKQHIQEGVLRFTDDALTRVCEDPLRILRYFRFASCLESLSLEKSLTQDYKMIFLEIRSGLADPSIVKRRRLWREFRKILTSPSCCVALDQMKECKILGSLGFPMKDIIDKSFKDLIDPKFTTDGILPKTKAAVILGIIFKGNIEKLTTLINRWKVSKEVKEASKIAAQIDGNTDVEEIKKFLYLVNSSTFQKEKNIRVLALKTDRCCGLTEDQICQLENFDRPVFPLTADHFAKVPQFQSKQKEAYENIKKAWIASGFSMRIDEMLDMIRRMAENLD